MLTLYYPYCVLSDVHFHDWHFGSHVGPDGVNSRLQHTIDAMKEAVDKLRSYGGKDLVITGDLFHVRGAIKPSVYNPVYEMFKEFSDNGIRVFAIPGNHDLETESSSSIGNSFNSFKSINNFFIFDEWDSIPLLNPLSRSSPTENAIFLPWQENMTEIEKVGDYCKKYLNTENATLFCHIGLSEVVDGLQGVTSATTLVEIFGGIRNVFSGHFHNHKHFYVNYAGKRSDVYSVGALTHQSFRDINSQAGFVIVENVNTVTHYTSHAPQFVEYNNYDFINGLDLSFIYNNYIRIGSSVDLLEEENTKIKLSMYGLGALGVISRASISSGLGEMIGISNPLEMVIGAGMTEKMGIKESVVKYVENRYSERESERIKYLLLEEEFDE